MNKYEEALNNISNIRIDSTNEYSNGFKNKCHKVITSSEDYKILKEAIEKANKYDEMLKDNVLDDENIGLSVVNTLIERANKYKQENSKLKQALKVYQEFSSLENINNKYYVIHFGGGDSNVEITQEQYNLLMEIENGN